MIMSAPRAATSDQKFAEKIFTSQLLFSMPVHPRRLFQLLGD